MTEEEVLAQLRDIHFPADLAEGASLALALWPFLVLGGLVLILVILRLVGRGRWRRTARGELAEIVALDDPDRQWTMLLAFASTLSDRAGRPVTLPDTAYLRPDRIGQTERTAFVAYLRAELLR